MIICNEKIIPSKSSSCKMCEGDWGKCLYASCSVYESYYCWQGAALNGLRLLGQWYSLHFAICPNGQGRSLKISMVTWELWISKYKRHNPSKDEGRPAIQQGTLTREGGREKMILTFLNQRAKEASCLTCAHDIRKIRDIPGWQECPTAAWEIIY